MDMASASMKSLAARKLIVPLFVSVVFVGPLTWMLMDREPPYIRHVGKVVPAAPQNCGMPPGPVSDKIMPGSCVSVEWQIRIIRNCQPNLENNITRRVLDAENVSWPLGQVSGLYGTKKKPSSVLTRYFVIPSGAQPGRAFYKSTATFACNPLQWLFWPVQVSVPDVEFEIAPHRFMLQQFRHRL